MQEYDKETLDEAIETLIEADEIQNDKDLMKAIEPELKKKTARMMKVLDMKELWKKSLEQASEKEYREEQGKEAEKAKAIKEKLKIKGERPLVDEEPKITGE